MSHVRVRSIPARTRRTEGQRCFREWLESQRESIPEWRGDPKEVGSAIHGILVYAQPYSGQLEGYYTGPGFDIITSRHIKHLAFKYDDAQTLEDSGTPSATEEPPKLVRDDAPEARDCDTLARDSQVNAQERAGALREWIATDDHAASTFIADELCRTDLPSEWREALVFAAEDAHFPTRELQDRVCGALRGIALELRTSSQPGIEQVVWSALRRFGSLVDSQAVDQFREFLSPAGYVNTRLLALQGVLRVFERRPPDAPESLTHLANRTLDIAAKLLDPDVFVSGETSAIATQAVLVLCVLGDRRSLECVERAKALGRRWVIGKLREQLEEIRAVWAEENQRVDDHTACTLVQEILSHLE